jgi:hypothetical protein
MWVADAVMRSPRLSLSPLRLGMSGWLTSVVVKLTETMCDGHKRCTRYPVFIATIHRMDRCNGLVNGRYQFCPACVRAVAYRLNEIFDYATEHGLPLVCGVCGRTVTGLHDMMDVEYIQESA